MAKEIDFPPNKDGLSKIRYSTSILVVGANGAGKTRLGSWIEFKSSQRDRVHRISAQKSLSMPDATTPKTIDVATGELLIGEKKYLPKLR